MIEQSLTVIMDEPCAEKFEATARDLQVVDAVLIFTLADGSSIACPLSAVVTNVIRSRHSNPPYAPQIDMRVTQK